MDFYRISEEYCQFLQAYEKEKRRVTKVPNISYADHNKSSFGAVMQVNGVSVGRFSPFRVGLKTPISVNLKSPMHHVCY